MESRNLLRIEMSLEVKDTHLLKSVPRIITVLVNWNSNDYTIPCIESLLKGKIPPSNIIVVDNGSTDGSPEIIEKEYPFVEIIRNTRNLGFAAGSNQGIRKALSIGADLVWVLNNDTQVDAECLSELLKASERFPNGACFSGKIYYMNPKNVVWYAGGYRHLLHLGPIHRGVGLADVEDQEETQEVTFLSGCCMLFPRWALESVGFFIEDYFCYSEDSEWSWRATSMGYQLLYVPNAVLWHQVSASARKNDQLGLSASTPATSIYFMARNHLWTIRLWVKPRRRKYSALFISVFIDVLAIVLHILKGDRTRGRAIWNGMYDGVSKPVPKWSFDR